MEDIPYRLLVNAITDYAIYMIDCSGYITCWNPGAKRLWGYEKLEVLDKHFSMFYIEEDQRQGLPAQALEISARDDSFESEDWRVHKDGRRFWAHIVIDPIRDHAGNLLGFANIIHDITERVHGEATLKRTEDQFRLLVQSVTDYGIYLLDPDGNVSSWNAGAQRIKGYAEQEIIGENFSVFYTEEDRQKGEPRRSLETATQEGRFEQDGWRVRKDGSLFRANVLISPIRSNSGVIAGFAEITRDMTEVAKAQIALKNAREALFQSQKMEAIGQLTGGVAHDFNNILMAVLGGLEVVRRRLPIDPHVTPLLENAAEAAQRGTVLTQRMLAFARRHQLKPEATDLSALVLGMTDLMRRSVGPSITIESCLPPALEPVYVDPNQLELAILNLVMNARDAMPNGGSITLQARLGNPYSLGNEYICLSVTDVGDGMDEATLAKVREPFSTSKGIGKGIGLGLSMVDGLAEQSGGQLVIKSRRGEGTVAEFWLPVESSGRGAKSGSDFADRVTAHPRPLVVLAVDSDKVVLKNTIGMLEELGHAGFGAMSGAQALDIVRRNRTLDLIIMDPNMPDMTNVELVEAIRAEAPSLQIIFTSTLANPSSAQLPKPFCRQQLLQVLTKMMSIVQASALA